MVSLGTSVLSMTEAIRVAANRGAPSVVLVRSDEAEERFSYTDLEASSRGAAAYLVAQGVRRHDRVPISLPTSRAFLVAYFATIRAGAIPCPIAMPSGLGSVDIFAERLRATTNYLGATHIVATARLQAKIAEVLPGLAALGGDQLLGAPVDPSFVPYEAEPDDIAFIQCTSGSTGSPKGVMLTHRNLVCQAEQCTRALEAGRSDVLVSWLPLHHDMGLIGGFLFPLYSGFDTVLLSPTDFQRRPAVWLRAISRYRGTISPAPNFAYRYITERARDEALEGVDLSSWRHALCGAEPINHLTLDAFVRRFTKFGLPAHAIQACYGLAEASLAVSFGGGGNPSVHDVVEAEALAAGMAIDVPEGFQDPVVHVVSCGRPVEGTSIRIVDSEGGTLPDDHVGRVLVSGPSVMKGYYELPEETRKILRDDWLDTGDVGYLRQGELRITGRERDIIIIRGRNYAPSEFEWAAEQVEGVRPGTAVAFGVPSERAGTELLHIVCEADGPTDALSTVQANVGAAVAKQTGLRPDVVRVTSREHVIPKTTSGKLRRSKMKELMLADRPSAVWRES